MRTIASIIAIALIIFVGYLVFRGNDGNLATDNATSTEENLNGIGGPEEGYDPLQDTDGDGEPDMYQEDGYSDKG
jgi:hypothetical protein